jgi:DNA mismatch endonuclease (patch repair protein)
MADIVAPEKRSKMMAGIRGKNTKPEMLVRRALFAKGLRFRLHRRDLPGTPDIVLPGRKVAIFVHGCFWHQHQGCRFAKMPASNKPFWEEKLRENIGRDRRNISRLLHNGWRVLIVWECLTRLKQDISQIGDDLISWIQSSEPFSELPLISLP